MIEDEKLIHRLLEEPMPAPPESLLQRLLDDIPTERFPTQVDSDRHLPRTLWMPMLAVVLVATSLSAWFAIDFSSEKDLLSNSSLSTNSRFQEWETDPCWVTPPLWE